MGTSCFTLGMPSHWNLFPLRRHGSLIMCSNVPERTTLKHTLQYYKLGWLLLTADITLRVTGGGFQPISEFSGCHTAHQHNMANYSCTSRHGETLQEDGVRLIKATPQFADRGLTNFYSAPRPTNDSLFELCYSTSENLTRDGRATKVCTLRRPR